jgi:NADPH:quinone reductase-like Zn-dependent oxidoreductase
LHACTHSGAFAEYAIADEAQVGLKPKGLSFAQAGVVPLVALTDLESFYAAGAPWFNRTNVTVVVTSGQGGTGHIAVPMAKALGATTVVSTASTANVDWVKSLGADVVVDYTQRSVWSTLPDDSVDVVYDNIGLAGNADEAMRVLRPGGALVMIQGDLSAHPKAGVSQARLLCKANDYRLLDAIAAMVDAGNVTDVRVQQAFPLAQVGEAYNELASGKVVGKVAVAVGAAPNATNSSPPSSSSRQQHARLV